MNAQWRKIHGTRDWTNLFFNFFRQWLVSRLLNWTAKETCHFFQRPHIKNHSIEINNFHTQICCNTPLLITQPKSSNYLHNKEEMDLHSNLVTESKVTDCNRITLTIFTQKSMPQDEIKSQSLLFNNVCTPLVSGHISGISGTCSGKNIWRSPVHSSCRSVTPISAQQL